jgi:hypothetical protein
MVRVLAHDGGDGGLELANLGEEGLRVGLRTMGGTIHKFVGTGVTEDFPRVGVGDRLVFRTHQVLGIGRVVALEARIDIGYINIDLVLGGGGGRGGLTHGMNMGVEILYLSLI